MEPCFSAVRGHTNMLLSIYTLQVFDYKGLTSNAGSRSVSTLWMGNLQSPRRIATFHSVFHRLRVLIRRRLAGFRQSSKASNCQGNTVLTQTLSSGRVETQIVCG